MQVADPHHPVWRWLQTVTYLGFAALFLWLNASEFDAGEVTTLMELGLLMAGVEGVKQRIKRTE